MKCLQIRNGRQFGAAIKVTSDTERVRNRRIGLQERQKTGIQRGRCAANNRDRAAHRFQRKFIVW